MVNRSCSCFWCIHALFILFLAAAATTSFHVLFQICMQLNHAEMIHALVEESRNKPAVLSAPCFTIAIKVAICGGTRRFCLLCI